MLQEIITYIIIFLTGIYTMIGIVRFFLPKKGKKGHVCSGSCAGCQLKNKTAAGLRISEYKF